MTLFGCIGTPNSIGVQGNITDVYMRLSERAIAPPGHTSITSVTVDPFKGNIRERGMDGIRFLNVFGFFFDSSLANIDALSERRIVAITSAGAVDCFAQFSSKSITLPDISTFTNIAQIASYLGKIGVNEQQFDGLLNTMVRQTQNNYSNQAAITNPSGYSRNFRNVRPNLRQLGIIEKLRWLSSLSKALTPSPERAVILARIIR